MELRHPSEDIFKNIQWTDPRRMDGTSWKTENFSRKRKMQGMRSSLPRTRAYNTSKISPAEGSQLSCYYPRHGPECNTELKKSEKRLETYSLEN